MEGWKSLGVFLTGFAATITAVTALIGYINEGYRFEQEDTSTQKKELRTQIQQLASVNDPDGWVNVRELPNSTSKVLSKLLNKQIVIIVDKTENWYRIRTNNDQIGYVYFDRLDLIYNDHLIIKK
jgi:hypothetical protein